MKRQRTGRNDPCPCGSGKKFKKCHLFGNREMERNGNNIQVAPAPVTVQPVATINIVLTSDGQVLINVSGQVNQFSLDGMLGCAKSFVQKKLDEAAKGPQVQRAPAGLRF